MSTPKDAPYKVKQRELEAALKKDAVYFKGLAPVGSLIRDRRGQYYRVGAGGNLERV